MNIKAIFISHHKEANVTIVAFAPYGHRDYDAIFYFDDSPDKILQFANINSFVIKDTK